MPVRSNLRILSVDRLDHGLIINYSDGTAAFYGTQFLYGAREYGDNHLVMADDEDEDGLG
jgi:hypothetical protein